MLKKTSLQRMTQPMQPLRQPSSPPVLVLGLGNVLLGDDGIGPELLRLVRDKFIQVPQVECIDGGTQGLALLGYLAGRTTLVLLDAFAAGKPPGEVTILNKSEITAANARHATTAHEGNASELLAVAQLLGELPDQVILVGIEPENVRTQLGLSPKVAAALPAAFACACEIIDQSLRAPANQISSGQVPLAV